MEKKKKNSVFTFIFSLIPGAAEMYMGFMKNGLSIMAVFVGSFLIPSLLHANDVWILIPLILYAFSFFHARNIVSSSEEAFELFEDRFIWEEFTDSKTSALSAGRLRNIFAVLLIIFGIIALWNIFRSSIEDLLPESIWTAVYPVVDMIPSAAAAVIIIIIGIRLIRGKKAELENEISEEAADHAEYAEETDFGRLLTADDTKKTDQEEAGYGA